MLRDGNGTFTPVSLPALQRLLGHDRMTTTEIYRNLAPEEVVREFLAKW
jgi:integrase/recombinase XerD